MSSLLRSLLVVLIFLTAEGELFAASKKEPRSKEQPYQVEGFDKSAERLPKGFLGLDVSRTAKVLAAPKGYGPKDDFESSDTFKQRIARPPESFKLYGSINAASVVALAAPIPVVDVSFYADDGLLVWKPNLGSKDKDGVYTETVDLGMTIKHLERYQGQNSYGARAQVDKVAVSENEVTIAIPEASASIVRGHWPFEHAFRVAFQTPPGIAKKVLDFRERENFRFLLIGKLRAPYVKTRAMSLGDATVATPVTGYVLTRGLILDVQAVWLYRVSTGEIIGKVQI